MKRMISYAAPAIVAVSLAGCGGGGGGGPTPAPSVPTPAPTPPPPTQMDISLLSYNLMWWRSHGDDVATTINANGQFDLMGFQECDDVSHFVNEVAKGNVTYGFKQGPQDIAIAWDTAKFENVSEGSATVGHDGWGGRSMHWVRLKIIGTEKHVLFANTHGPVNQCNHNEQWKETAANYVKNIQDNMKEGDFMYFTGDFNCGTPSDLMRQVRETFHDAAQASFFKPILYQPDHIFTLKEDATDWAAVCCDRPGNCHDTNQTGESGKDKGNNCWAMPSDHMLLRATFHEDLNKGAVEIV